ncbi:hemolysin family protein [Desulfovibrio inopinatus]|uniref:hemolysin family protein n=1 Tax=Desulfovibrio inopinatus TaxID=102109 RepID=UPI000400714C|nr:hemolysin family protein [Desulfovibrio inopinatus]
MEEGSEGKFWSAIRSFFHNKNDLAIEDLIVAAKEEGEIITDEASMLLNVLELEEKTAHDIMAPRTDIVCVELEEGIAAVGQQIVESGHSRIPIYRENKDHIVGIVYAKDILPCLLDPDCTTKDIEPIMRAPLFVPASLNLKDLLFEFRSKKKHIVIILDEYGGTAGLVTLEDVLEEIVGEIEDEHDPDKPTEFKSLGNGKYLISGRLMLDELEENTGIALVSDQVETVGGYLSELAGRVPQQGEMFTVEHYTFRIKEADKRQVRWILIEQEEQPLSAIELPKPGSG